MVFADGAPIMSATGSLVWGGIYVFVTGVNGFGFTAVCAGGETGCCCELLFDGVILGLLIRSAFIHADWLIDYVIFCDGI